MNYIPRHKPYKHQQQALDLLKDKKAFALLMAMRCGKSKTLLDDFGRLEDAGEVQDLLIIAPAGVYRTWETAINDHVSDALLSRLKIHIWSSTANKTKQRELEVFLNDLSSPRVLMVNIEALSSVKRAKDLALTFLSQRKSMCVVDESTGIKNPQAERTKFIVQKLAPLATYRRIL